MYLCACTSILYTQVYMYVYTYSYCMCICVHAHTYVFACMYTQSAFSPEAMMKYFFMVTMVPSCGHCLAEPRADRV